VRRLQTRILIFVAIIQSILFLAHAFVYETWTRFRAVPDPPGITRLQAVVALLSISFVAATLLSFRYSNPPVRLFYGAAAVWMGFFNFFFVAACLCWVTYAGGRLLGLSPGRPLIAGTMFGLAVLAGVYGIVNARMIRVTRIAVQLPNLPLAWHGRASALVTDVHLGSVNGAEFVRTIIAKLRPLRPDIVFIAGDLYDGSKVDPYAAMAPWKEFSPPLGTYFVTGNHEEFTNPAKYLNAVSASGIRVLNNEKALVDGLQIVGVHDVALANPDRLRTILKSLDLERGQASILLAHTPSRLPIAEEAGISLQLSGHTHRGQIFPFTWLTGRIFGEYAYGLNRFQDLLVYTSSGAGTWGPPMRVGSQPEIVLIRFD
jgi:predicted MPP superfamily phosphohydrolase